MINFDFDAMGATMTELAEEIETVQAELKSFKAENAGDLAYLVNAQAHLEWLWSVEWNRQEDEYFSDMEFAS